MLLGGLCEGLFAVVRGHEINEGFLVTGFLIPLTMPPTIPLWMLAIATIFGVVIGKEIFGGTGYNIFNPALTALEFPNALGCYDKLVEGLFGNVKWYVGPRGLKHSQFRTHGKKSDEKITCLYDYDGPEELDYTIWTKDCILLFEAKVVDRENEGLDIGWHKMAYPAARFSKINNYTIKPIYFLRWENTIHLFVFPKFQFYNDGIIINDKKIICMDSGTLLSKRIK